MGRRTWFGRREFELNYKVLIAITMKSKNREEAATLDFEGGDAGASETYPVQCSGLRKNGHVMIKGRPCKIVDMSTSKTGKHGHAKVSLVAVDLFTDRKYEDACPSTHNMEVPTVTRKDFQFVHLEEEDNYVRYLDDKGTIRSIRVDHGELLEEIALKRDRDEDFYVSILRACGEEKVLGVKPMS